MKLPGASVFGLLFVISSLVAQENHGVTPADIQRGAQIFLTSCARCHGENGDAVSGVSLFSNKFRRAQTDADLTNIIRKGIPGTAMPPGNYADDQVFAIVAYLRSSPAGLRTSAAIVGDAARGRAVVEAKGQCLSCHRVGEAGGYTGPDLSAIGSARRPPEIERSITEPSFEIRDANRPIRAVTQDGVVIQGTLLNYDTYSLQLIDTKGNLRALRLDKLKEHEFLKTSPMPSYQGKLSAHEIADVVIYLSGLKGTN